MDSPGGDLIAAEDLQQIIDRLNANVAVLGRDGTIELVNRSWVRFATDNGPPGARAAGPGTNYFDACGSGAVVDGDFADRALDGIRRVLGREIPAYSMEYPCHSPQEERWFVMLVAPVGADRVMVTHVDVSAAPRTAV